MEHCQEHVLEKKYHESLEIFNEKIPSCEINFSNGIVYMMNVFLGSKW